VKISECVEKLFVDDPASPPGHRLKSYLLLHEGDTTEALTHLKKALEGDPGDTETLLWYSYLLAIHAGRPAEAHPIAEKWLAVDPLHPISKMCVYLSQWMGGDLNSASQGLVEWIRNDRDNPIPNFYLGHIFAWTGRKKEALAIAEKMHNADPDEVMGQALYFMTLALNGHSEKALEGLTKDIKECLWMDFHLPWLVAEGYALLGETDEALSWLERAVDKGIFNYPMLNCMDPMLENIRHEPRFKSLMKRVKSMWEEFTL
jgi:predicted Zn-dependent protease